MVYCWVPFCTSQGGKTPNVSFHEFPSDSNLREKWLKVIRRKDAVPGPSGKTVVCSLHFTKDDFDPNRKRKILLKDSIPSVFPNYPSYMQPPVKKPRRPISSRRTVIKNTDKNKIAKKPEEVNIDISSSPEVFNAKADVATQADFRKVAVNKELNLLKKQLHHCKNLLQTRTAEFKQLRKEVEDIKRSKWYMLYHDITEKAAEGDPSALFLQDQINNFNSSKSTWSDCTLRYSIIMKNCSPECYNLFRENKILKLPSRTTLLNHIGDMDGGIRTDKTKIGLNSSSSSYDVKNLFLNERAVNREGLSSADWDIDYCTPTHVLSSLLEPYKLTDFINEYWEKKPLVLERSKYPAVVSCFAKFFSKDILLELLQKHSLEFVKDVNCCCYINGCRKYLNGKGKITVKKVISLLEKEGGTLQIHQPQRFVSCLWKLMEKLECYFSCLVGANVYITPSGSQGLPPHYDDVEVFILQLEGEKEWKLYQPPVMLPRTYSRDLSQEEIGEPTHQFMLKPGDLLYMPRGIVHQAKTPEKSSSHSTHITISTYQKHAVGDYMMSVFPILLEKAMDVSQNYRQGLPIGFLSQFKISQTVISELLEELPEISRGCELPVPHSLLCDFMKSRLPPFGIDRDSILECAPAGKSPDLQSLVYLTYPDHTSWVESELQDDDDLCHSYLLVYTSVTNDRSIHMMFCDEDNELGNALKFPVHYRAAMEQLKISYPQPFCVNKLSLYQDEEKVQLATTLWSQHLLRVAEDHEYYLSSKTVQQV